MEFVEIDANRKPKLTGGRRGSATLLPGGTNVNSHLLPVSQLPASAGNLANALQNERRGSIRRICEIGPEAPRPIKLGGKKMSSLVPEHGHGANTQIGTNFKLAQFGGSQPVVPNNMLSPALSTMSVGAGRRKSKKGGKFNLINTIKDVGRTIGKPYEALGFNPFTIGYDLGHDVIGPAINRKLGRGREPKPKGKDLLKLVKYMADTKAKLHGMKTGGGWFSSAFDVLKDVGKTLIDKHGKDLLNKGKDLLLAEIGKKANEYIGAGVLHGGSFFDTITHGIQALLNPNVASQLLHHLTGGNWFDDVVGVVKKVGHAIGKPFEVVGVNPWDIGYDLGHDVIGPAINRKLGRGMPGANHTGIRKIGGAKKPSARGAIVSKIMKEKNLSLPMASKYVKEHGLY